MLKSNKIVLTSAQIIVHAHNSILSLVKKFLCSTSGFNVVKLLTTAACTTEKGKAGANAQRPTPGLGHFFVKEGAY